MTRLTVAPALALVALLFTGACSRQAEAHHPRTALDSYISAVEANNPRAAYALLSKKVRDKIPFQDFAIRWKKDYADLKVQAEDLRKVQAKPEVYEVQATIDVGGKRSVSLALEEGSWRIKGGVGAGFDSLSPKEAILGLLRALEARNFSAFLKLLSKPRREQFLRELSLRLEKLKANMDRELEVTGNRARFQYDPNYWIQLVKEDGVWKIVEFN